MPQTSAAGPPAWVSRTDGRLEPFDADKICHALFAASEALGSPNAFLARELTDAVVHFLAVDPGDPAPSTAHVAEQVVKVVRELGQPALAHAFTLAARRHGEAERPPAQDRKKPVHFMFDADDDPQVVARQCLDAYTEHAVFSRDLVAAARDGLLVLAGLDTPRSLARCVLESGRGPGGWMNLGADPASRLDAAGQGLVLDGPEWHDPGIDDSATREIYRAFLLRLSAFARRHVVINLNAAQPPAWARYRNAGPLFTEDTGPGAPDGPPLLDVLVDALAEPTAGLTRWDWHVQGRDFTASPHRERLHRLARYAVEGRSVAFVFDRPRRPVALAEGIDRQHPGILMELGLDLRAFLRLPEIAGRSDAFHEKLPSLIRMAVSAGSQKRKYLRRFGEGTQLGRGFLLDRARLCVVPFGLESVIRKLTGNGSASSPQALTAAEAIVHTIHHNLQKAGQAAHLEVVIDGPGPGLAARLAPPDLRHAGLSCADPGVPPERQLEAAGRLHAVAGPGTAHLVVPPDGSLGPPELFDLLHFAYRRTEVGRIAFLRSAAPDQQPEFADA